MTASIGVKTVRELYGVGRSMRAKTFFVATCRFTKSASKFAKSNQMQIWDKENIIDKTTIPN